MARGESNIGKSKVEAVRAFGALRETLRSFVDAHIFGHGNKFTAHSRAPGGEIEISVQIASSGEREAAINSVAENYGEYGDRYTVVKTGGSRVMAFVNA
eukprot:6206597-Pleurochrysis_carterae.AAC.3